MRRIEDYLKKYLKNDLQGMEKTPQCLSREILLGYLGGSLNSREREEAEKHLGGCNFCLSQLNLAFEAEKLKKYRRYGKVPVTAVNKAKALLKDDRKDSRAKKMLSRAKKHLFLSGAIVFFIASFLLPKYFMQCLAAALILGIRWVFESENGRILVMVLDSWRRHSQDKDNEITNRLKDRFKSPRT